MSFLGMKASQSYEDFPIWEEFFNRYPVQTFVELGTDNGGMTVFFALQCAQRGIHHFHTFDNQDWVDYSRGLPHLLNLRSTFHHYDLFSEEGIRAVSEIIVNSPKPLAIFFDDGDKPREWKTFAHLTSPGDFCIVHDWGVEFHAADLGDVKVERIMTDMADARRMDWRAEWFRRLE